MKKKIISLVLALLVCCSAAFLFAGCMGTPNNSSTLIVTNSQVFTFEALVKKDDKGKVVARGKDNPDTVKAAIPLKYTANGEVYYERDKEGRLVMTEYQDWEGTYKKAEEECEGKNTTEENKTKKVITCNFSGLDLTTKTNENETRTLTIVINNATVKVKYKVVDPS